MAMYYVNSKWRTDSRRMRDRFFGNL